MPFIKQKNGHVGCPGRGYKFLVRFERGGVERIIDGKALAGTEHV